MYHFIYIHKTKKLILEFLFFNAIRRVVESVGDEVKEVKEGDIVIPTYVGECKDCENCTSRISNLCLKYPIALNGLMLDGTSRMSVRGQKLYHIFSCSTWSEYMVIDANYVVKVDPSIDPSDASFLSCGFTTGYGAAWKEAKVEKGSSVAVLGLGTVGLGVCYVQNGKNNFSVVKSNVVIVVICNCRLLMEPGCKGQLR